MKRVQNVAKRGLGFQTEMHLERARERRGEASPVTAVLALFADVVAPPRVDSSRVLGAAVDAHALGGGAKHVAGGVVGKAEDESASKGRHDFELAAHAASAGAQTRRRRARLGLQTSVPHRHEALRHLMRLAVLEIENTPSSRIHNKHTLLPRLVHLSPFEQHTYKEKKKKKKKKKNTQTQCYLPNLWLDL